MKNILSLILLSIVFCAASGQEQAQMPKKTSLFFRYGKILSAEACSSKPEIKEPTLIMARSRNSVYVEIIFQPDKGRSFSMHDFALADASGKEYPCIAVAEGDNSYSGIIWNFRDMDGATRHRMLFAAPSADGEFTLVFKLFPSKIKEKTFKLKTVSRFSKAAEILNKGQLILPEPPPPPKPPEEPKEGEKNDGEKKEGEKKDGGEGAPAGENPPE